MPGGDRTGPAGMGPMTGRAAGYCAGYPTPGYMSPMPGRGYWGRGGGGGRGWRNMYRATGLTGWQRGSPGFSGRGVAPWGYPGPYETPYPYAPTEEQELESLRSEAKYLEDGLNNIRKRMDELEASATDEDKG